MTFGHEPTRELTIGQRLMLGLAVAPVAALLALQTLAGARLSWATASSLRVLYEAGYVLFMSGLAAWTAWMAATGRAPGRR